MKIKTDADNYVLGYVTIGDMDGAIEFDGVIPDGFDAETCRCYRLTDGLLVLDETRLENMQQTKAIVTELTEIYAWFDWYYDQVKQYEICQRIGESFEQDITALDAEAVLKNTRKKEILTILG